MLKDTIQEQNPLTMLKTDPNGRSDACMINRDEHTKNLIQVGKK
jgi:hypothetical protein